MTISDSQIDEFIAKIKRDVAGLTPVEAEMILAMAHFDIAAKTCRLESGSDNPDLMVGRLLGSYDKYLEIRLDHPDPDITS